MRAHLSAGRRVPRLVRRVATVAVVALVAGACGGDDEGGANGEDPGTSDETTVARTVLQVGNPDLVLEPQLLREHLVVLFQVNGRLARADAECAADGFLGQLGEADTLAQLPLAEVLSADTRRDRRLAVDACVEEPVGPAAPQDPFEAEEPEPLPEDLSPEALRAHLVEWTAVVASSLGMTPEEADCFGTRAYGDLDDEQIVATLEPAAAPEVELPERTGVDEVRACLTPDRVDTLVEELRPVLEAHERAVAAAEEPLTVTPGG